MMQRVTTMIQLTAMTVLASIPKRTLIVTETVLKISTVTMFVAVMQQRMTVVYVKVMAQAVQFSCLLEK
jgi:hypothetical protein